MSLGTVSVFVFSESRLADKKHIPSPATQLCVVQGVCTFALRVVMEIVPEIIINPKRT